MKFLAVVGLIHVLSGVQCDAEADPDPAILNSFLPSYNKLDQTGRYVYVVNPVAENNEESKTVIPNYHFNPYYPGVCGFGNCGGIPSFNNGFNAPWSYAGYPWSAYQGNYQLLMYF